MPVFGVEREQDLDFQGVYRVQPDGENVQLLVDDFKQPNGLCFSPDEKTLYVNDSDRALIEAFEIKPDGTFGSRSVFFDRRIGTGDLDDGHPGRDEVRRARATST